MSRSKFESMPGVVLEEIAFSLVALSFLGPPTGIITMLLLSKYASEKISLPHLYARIFAFKFDTHAAIRRLGNGSGYVHAFTYELCRRFESLKRLKNKEASRRRILKIDLWRAYLMFLESDGKNSQQLIRYARVHEFAQGHVSCGRLFYPYNENWVINNEINSLVVWLFWYTDKERVANETPEQSYLIARHFIQLFRCFHLFPSTYASTTFAANPIMPPLPFMTSPIVPSIAPLSSPPCIIPDYFGSGIAFAKPLIVPPALLSTMVRLEMLNDNIFESLWPVMPPTRELANAIGWDGPTHEDHEAHQVKTSCVDWTHETVGDSKRHDDDWARLSCNNRWLSHPVRDLTFKFMPGMLHGTWAGQYILTRLHEIDDYVFSLRTGVPFTPPFLPLIPMKFTLREHHQFDKNGLDMLDQMAYRCGGMMGVLNAWLPEGTTLKKLYDCMQLHVPGAERTISYPTYNPATSANLQDPEMENCGFFGQGVWDIIVTAEADETFARSWGPMRYYGRVREWDGLVVLVRISPPNEGRWIFYGYVHGRQNLVGRWFYAGTTDDATNVSGVWTMTKVGD